MRHRQKRRNTKNIGKEIPKPYTDSGGFGLQWLYVARFQRFGSELSCRKTFGLGFRGCLVGSVEAWNTFCLKRFPLDSCVRVVWG